MSSFRNYQIKKQFSPKLMRYKTPTYNQRKGRILQTSPYLIQNNKHMDFMSQEKLQKMYETLQKYNYIPAPIIPQMDYFSYILENIDMDQFRDWTPITQSSLSQIASTFISQLPSLPSGYRYVTELVRFFIDYPGNANASTGNFTLLWKTDLLSNTTQHIIFKKNLSLQTTENYHVVSQINPFSSTQVILPSIIVNSSSPFLSANNYIYDTTDFVNSDDIYYPFVSDNPSQETYGSSIEYTNWEPGTNFFNFRIQFVFYPLRVTI